jgi:hypothetical protein
LSKPVLHADKEWSEHLSGPQHKVLVEKANPYCTDGINKGLSKRFVDSCERC